MHTQEHSNAPRLFGNITVAYLSASIFLFGGALNGWDGLVHIIPIAVITFFAMLSRELVKDAEDVARGQGGRRRYCSDPVWH